MHTIQYVAVKAESVEEAHEKVKSHLEMEMGPEDSYNSWYDWFVVGGGRWATGDENQYNDEWLGDIAHQDDPRFKEYLDKAREYRKTALQEYIDSARKSKILALLDDLEKADPFTEHFRIGMELYTLHQLYRMAMGQWSYDSFYFDVEHESANPIHLLNSLDKGDKDWYLVPIDFHY